MSTQLENETQELLGKVVQDFTGAIATRMCAIGIDLGLIDDLAENGASTSREIAERKLELEEEKIKSQEDIAALRAGVDRDRNRRGGKS